MSSHTRIGMLAATLVLAVGCGGTNASAAVAWTDSVCGALGNFTRAVATAPPTLDPAQPAAAVRDLAAYLGAAATAVDESIRGLDAAGPSPVAGGDEYVERLKTTLTSIRTSFAAASTGLAGIDTSSPEAVTKGLPAVLAPLQQLSGLADPTAGLQSTDELKAATEQAPNCRALRIG